MRKVIEITGAIFAVASGLAIVLQTLVVSYEAIARRVFSQPTFWALEISEYLLVLATYLPAAYILRADIHVRFGFVAERFSKRTQCILGIIVGVLSLLCCGVFVWQSWGLAYRSLVFGRASTTLLGAPLYLPQLIVAIGLFVFSLQFLIRIQDYIQSMRRGQRE